MEIQEIKNYQIGTKYRVKIERSATKGVDGWQIEANGDTISDVMGDIASLHWEITKMMNKETPILTDSSWAAKDANK